MLRLHILFLCWSFVKPDDFNDTGVSSHSGANFYPTVPACYYNYVGSEGSVQSPPFLRTYRYSIDCIWDIDVTKNYATEFEFETFRLPASQDHECEAYIEMSYAAHQEGMIKRIFCPYDKVGRIYTDSQTVHIRFHSGKYYEEYRNKSYGFKINYSAVAVNKSTDNHAVLISLVSFAALAVAALCVCCIRSRHRAERSGRIPRHLVVTGLPNAPTRTELQQAFDFHRSEVMQAPQNEHRHLSRTSSVSIAQRKDSRVDVTAFPFAPHSTVLSYSNPGAGAEWDTFRGPEKCLYLLYYNSWRNDMHYKILEEQKISKISIASTPRSVFATTRSGRRSGAQRIAQLRTKLVARFSSGSSLGSSDISVYFPAMDRRSYSQLDNEVENSPEERTRPEANAPKTVIPSIVIEFVE